VNRPILDNSNEYSKISIEVCGEPGDNDTEKKIKLFITLVKWLE